MMETWPPLVIISPTGIVLAIKDSRFNAGPGWDLLCKKLSYPPACGTCICSALTVPYINFLLCDEYWTVM